MTMNYQQQLNDFAAEHRAATAAVKTEQDTLTAAENALDAHHGARTIIQSVASAIQQEAHSRVAGVVSRCLSTVFGPDAYEFRIEFEEKRGRTEARLVFVRDGMELSPMTAAGGGAVDVASFALRLAALMLSRPSVRKCLVLDEPFKHLSREYRPRMAELLLELAAELGMQFVVVTHDPDLACGKVVKLG